MSIANVVLTSNAKAQVTVTLEIPIGSSWSGTTEVNQIVGQAKDEARGKLFDLVRNGARIIGDPIVKIIMVEAQDRNA